MLLHNGKIFFFFLAFMDHDKTLLYFLEQYDAL